MNSPDAISELKSWIERLSRRLDEANAVIDIARILVKGGQQRRARSKAMQEAATLARKGGPSGKAAIEAVERKHPMVVDISDAVDAIEAAINKYDKGV